jgi:hypothetical protein
MKKENFYRAYLILVIVFLIGDQASAQTCVAPASNLISWWRAEGNALDTRNLHNGTLQNGAFYANGRVGQAFAFDGVNDSILLGNQPGLQPNSITIEAWIRMSEAPTGLQNVFAKWGFDATVDSYLFGVINSGGVLKVFGAVGDGSTGDPGLSGGDMSIQVWTHVAMTYNAADGTHKLFVNGVEVASRVRPNGIFPTVSNAYFGREDSNEQRFFNGLVDELSVYSRALSQSEIQAIVNAGTAGKCQSNNQLSGRFAQRQKLLTNPTVGNIGFGFSIAVSGDTMVVGANGYDTTPTTEINRGAAYVFVRNASGAWTQQAQLLASDGAAGDEFGYSVAISGNTIVVGSLRSNAPASNSGAAYVFTRAGTTWTQQQKLTASDGAADDEFGNAVAISSNTVAVGSHSADQPSGGGHAGAVYIFNRSGSVWTQAQKLIPTGQVLFGDFLGESVAISGDTLVAGASGDQEPNRTNRGTVYVYTRSGSTFTQQQKLVVPDTQPSTQLGASIAVDGDTIVSGALGDTPTVSQPNHGAAYVFARSGANWTLQQRLIASDGAMSDFFGWSVSVSGDTLAVGSRYDDTTTGTDAGSAYVFTRNNSTWTERQKLAPTDAAAGDRFGASAALNADGTLIVGAADKNLPAGQGNGAGAAYVFNVGRPTLFDFDGDGKSDVSVFRPSNGAWYLQQSTAGFTGATFGQNGDLIAPADYDGDGKTDLAVFRNGTWYLLRTTLGFTGISFGQAGDIPVPADYDGDGKADVAVFRQPGGIWYLQRSTLGFTGIAFGTTGDAPVPADYDGDGKADIAVFREPTGTWYLQQSTAGFTGLTFGTGGDKAVPADYDGDGKADVAVFRPSNGAWYLQRSQLGFTGIAFGQTGDRPVPADYDGDGKTDVAVFRGGTWYLNQSQAGFTGIAFGASTDLPTPAAFLP